MLTGSDPAMPCRARHEIIPGDPIPENEACAIPHNNLATCMEPTQAAFDEVLPHRLAAGAIWFQISSGLLRDVLHKLARTSLPPSPPSFEEVTRRVEEIDGVHFRELFERLPKRAPDGDAAIAEVWRLAQEEKERQAPSVPS